MDKWINLCEPITGIEEINSVSKALKDGWVSSAGPVVCEAEKMVCEKTGAKFGVACTSGTSALHLSLICSGVNRSEHVIVPSLSFIASVNPVLYCGADPIFLDSDSDYGYIDPLGLVSFLREETLIKKNLLIYKKTNRVIRAMIVTDLLGHPAPWELYRSIRGDIPLVFIEDSAQSLGSKAGSVCCGNMADIGCLSFNGNKIITAGQGGMLLTNNKKVAEKARYYSTQAKDDPFYFVHSEIGYNYRMNSLSSALLIAQLQKLDSFVEKKREIFEVYKNKLSANRRIRLVEEPENTKSNYWMTAIIAESENLRNEIIKTLENNKIQTRPFWAPLNKQKHLKPFCHKDMKNTEALSSQGLFLPSGVNLTNDQINKVCKVILSFLN